MKRLIGLLALGVAVGSGACTLKVDDGQRFKDPIPQSGDVATGVPGTSSGTARSASLTTIHLAGNPTGPASYAKYYQVTRDMADGVDTATAWVLGLVWAIVNLPPTHVEDHKAVWGPGQGDALSPVVWRFTVVEVGNREYDYTLEGRPRASTSEADFRAVLTGHGFGKERPEHRLGDFALDFDASHALDPARNKDVGEARVNFDLRTFPATIAVDAQADAQHTVVNVTHQADGGGAVDITAHADIEAVKDGNLEDLILHSRWDATGAGRGDAQVSGGDLPATTPIVQASECWNTSFARVYYKDSANFEPEAGNAASCVFAQASF